MTGSTLTPQAVNNLFGLNDAGVGQPQLSPSIVNSYRVAAVAGRLLAHVKSGYRGEAMEFFNLCLSLSRGIDYAVANNEVPTITHDLPVLLKQICQRKSDKVLEAAIMVLMISVKNACKIGWFSEKETEELFSLANEIGSGFCSMADVKTGPSCSLSILDKIMERYYPLMKMGEILASMEVKPGYGAHVLDFHIAKSTVYSPQEKIRLFVAQTDNIETSACITTPQQVNLLLNGKGVDRRINVSMDTGPQMPSIVTGMLKFGSNLLQAVGQFNGHYIIAVAFMSVTSSLGSPALKDYAQPIVPSSNADSDIVEGPSRISLNCPISYTRIKTPAKGHLCKHLQCFDVSNYVGINVRRPSWRCPHCNQSICYLDIRIDQNMVKVLGEVGKNVTEVIISMDGSWKAVLEGDDDLDRVHDNALLKETNDLEESNQVSTALPIVLDLTEDDSEMDLVSASETEDVKPLRNTNTANQSVASQVEDDFWTGIQFPNGSSTSGTMSNMQIDGGISHSGPANYYQSPVLTDAISLAFDRGTESQVNTNLVASAMQSQYSSPSYLQSQQVQFPSSTASNEYGRFRTHLALPRTPTAVQAVPVQSPATDSQQRLRTPIPSSASLSSQSIPPTASGVNAICSDLERQQHFSRIQMNSPLVTNIASSQQNLSQITQFQNPHLQQTLNPRTPQTMGQSSSTLRSSSLLSRAHIQPGSAQVGTGQTSGSLNNQQRSTVNAQRAAMMAGKSPSTSVQNQTHTINHPVPLSAGEQSRNVGGTTQAVLGTAGAADLSPEQDWRPTGRMRGSLQGRAYSAALNQFIIAPTQPTQGVRPSNLTSPLPTVPSHIQALMGSRSTQVPQTPIRHPQ